MSRVSDNSLVLADAIGTAEEPAAPNPFLLIHRALRGHYIIVGVLAFVMGIAGAAAGWMATKPKYESQGWIRAFPRQQRILYETDENQSMAGFDAFVRSQVSLIRTRRVIDMALKDPKLTASGWTADPEGVQRLLDSLQVDAARGSELISVSVSDPDPTVAQDAANAVLDAFMVFQDEQDGISVTARGQRLQNIQKAVSAELATIRNSIARATEAFGGGDLEMLIQSKTAQLTRIDDAELDPARLNAPFARPGSVTGASLTPQEMTVEQLAEVDFKLRELLGQQMSLEIQLQTVQKELAPEHRQIRTLRSRMEAIKSLVESRASEVRSTLAPQTEDSAIADASTPTTPAESNQTQSPPTQSSIRERLSEDLRKLALISVQLRELRDREAEAEKRLAETTRTLEALRVEDEIIRGGRLRIQQIAATPLRPSKDRRLPLAGAGFAAGAGGVVALFVGFNLLRGRVRYADDLEPVVGQVPVIGVVRKARRGDEETREAISFAFHHARNALLLLEAGVPSARGGGRVILISSAMQGEGKTTVALALGTSFATAGLRVSLMDFDFVGRGMTRDFGAQDQPGLSDALDRGATDVRAVRDETHKLDLIPAGTRDEQHAKRLTIEAIRPVIESTRSRSDIVIIDTGPILGSLEVGLIAPLCDTFVLVASRGTPANLVNAALRRARHLCGDRIAMIFNRAAPQDVSNSTSLSSLRSTPEGSEQSRRADGARLARMLMDPPSNGSRPTNGTSI